MIKPEVALIKILLDIDMYQQYRSYINIKEDREIQLLYSMLDKLITEYNRSLTFDDYRLFVLNNIQDKDEVYEQILDNLYKTELSSDIAQVLLQQFKERNLAHKIALLAIDVEEGKKSFNELTKSIESYEETQQEIEEDIFVTDDLEEIFQQTMAKHGFRWRLKTLNRMLGSLRKGDFGFVFARPETGKTTFLASEVTFFATQLGEEDGDIYWFNNEEEGKKVKSRTFQGCLGITHLELYKDRKTSQEEYQKLQGHRIKLIDRPTISKQEVEQICRKGKPSLIIFDQLDKIRGFEGEREDLRLGTIYQWARELAKTYGPVIAVCQADGSGEGKKWLTMENVANAKTAKQAEADWILGIGCTHQDGFEYVRHLHASKNKLTGDEDTDPKLRHGKVDVIIEPETARYKDYE